MEQRPLPISASRLIDDIKAGVEKTYDALELLDKVAQRLGEDALKDNVKLQSAAETLQDILVIAGNLSSMPTIKNQLPAPVEIRASIDIKTDHEGPLAFESDEAFAIIGRYFWHRAGEPLAWEQLGDHLRKNNVATPDDEELSDIILDWQEDIQEAINSNETYQFKGRWIEFNGSWVFAEIITPARAAAPTKRQTKTITPAVPPIIIEQPVPIVAQPEEMQSAKSLEDDVRTLMPASGYARYNSLRNKLIGTRNIKDEATATDALDAMIQDGEIFSFRTNGARHLSFDRSLAEQLHTERMKRTRQTKEAAAESSFDNHEAATSVICAFLLPGRHIEQAMTYKEISEETSYPVDIIKPTVSYLKEQGYVSTALGALKRGGHRSASQQIMRVRLISQDMKDGLRKMDRREILELISKRAGEIRELSTANR